MALREPSRTGQLRCRPDRTVPISSFSQGTNSGDDTLKSHCRGFPSTVGQGSCLRRPILRLRKRPWATLAQSVAPPFAWRLMRRTVRFSCSPASRSSPTLLAVRLESFENAAQDSLWQEDDEDDQQHAVDKIVPAHCLGSKPDAQDFRKQDRDDCANGWPKRDIESAD